MTTRLWLRILVSLVGLAALSALVWFGGPFAGYGSVYPFEDVGPRLVVIFILALLVAGFIGYEVWKRSKQTAAIEASLAEAEASGDGDVIADRMKDAITTLKKATGGSANYLYDLPWYMMIGPPGSGKTTALINSGLKFPLARGASPEAIAGTGGTRYCDWWFTEEAVLIDTAGRYTTQDSDAKADKKSWTAFLDLLKQNRPRQPINGVLVCISVEDLLKCSPAEVQAHADAIRARLLELHTQLRVDFPVYALFTKLDLVAGFLEYFSHLNEQGRRVVWGHTFQTDDKTQNMIHEVGPEFDALIERLNMEIPDRMQEEPTPASRVQVFGFPSQMAALKPLIADFLGRIFEPTRYHTNATLRGFYFTSGTQAGTPIDQLLGALHKSFGASQMAVPVMSGSGKSYFLHDLITKVIIGESAWVSTDRRAVRRSFLLRAASFTALFAASAAAAGAWWVSYNKNADLIAASNEQTKAFVAAAAPVIQEPNVSDRDFAKIEPFLNQLRTLPGGYGIKDQSAPSHSGYGLSQWARLGDSAEATYKTGLERWLRPRLVYRLEELIEGNLNNPDFVYEALKVYLILGGRQKMDEELILNWVRRDFAEVLYPGATFTRLRASLDEHMLAMFKLEGGNPVQLNEALIEEAQRVLARLSLAQRAYQLLKSQARPGPGKDDWIVERKAGVDAATVFSARSGATFDTVRVPYFFTYDGFHEAFIGKMRDVAVQIQSERWVLGAAGSGDALASQYDTLPQALLALYSREHDEVWRRALQQITLKPLNAGKPQYPALSAISSVTSPLKQLLESIRDETKLSVEKKKPAAPAGGNLQQQAATARNVLNEAQNFVSTPNIANRALDLALRNMEKKGQDVNPQDLPGRDIETRFRAFHNALEGDAGRRPIDQVLTALNDVNQNFRLLATNPTMLQQVTATLPQQIQVLRNAANLLPAPFSQMLIDAANQIDQEVTGSSVSALMQALREQVTGACQQIVGQNYPFNRGSSREVPVADFGRLFGTGGILDGFFKKNLESMVDTSRSPWSYKQNISVARALPLASLREFERAEQIRQAFFPQGGQVPMLQPLITPMFSPQSGEMVRLEINGIAIMPAAQGLSPASAVQWPGPGGLDRVLLTVQTSGFFGAGPPSVLLDQRRAWGLFRFLDQSGVSWQGETGFFTLSAGGRGARYQIQVSSLPNRNPFRLPVLQEFRCPGG